MSHVLHNDPSRETRLNEVLLAYVEARQAGQELDQCQLLAAHPDFQDELKAFFASHAQVERIAAPFRQASREPAVSGADPECAANGRTTDIGQLGDFRLLREIGRGGMGVVYEAEQISLRRRVALKVLPFAAAIDSRQRQRFQNEALAAAHLRHENIVPVHAVGSERGVHYYAMQFVDGQSLASLIGQLRGFAENPPRQENGSADRPPLAAPTTSPLMAAAGVETQPENADHLRAASISRQRCSGKQWYFHWVADLGRQAAQALEHAHERGIVHRDIKPANLLLDGHGQVWITDFGLAQCGTSTGLTVTGELVGTLRYASPEQTLGKRGLVDQRTDIYSLGATLYELLTLQPIFDGRDRHELLQQIADAEPRPPRSLDRMMPEELETIVLKAIAKEPSERYATAQELAEDLQRFREDRPISARRPSALEKTTKWARRHKRAVVSAVLVLLLLAAGMSATTLLVAQAYERERQARARAERSFREAREAVDQFARIGEVEFAGNPLLEATRRRMLATALDYYKNFIDQRHDDPSTCDELEASRAKAEKILNELTTLMRMDQYTLLQQEAVQDLLQLSEKKRKAVAEIDALWRTAVGEFHGSIPDWERRRLELGQEQEKRIEHILDPNQLHRFKQIVLQSLGPAAFREPDVMAALKLTSAQYERIRAIEANTAVTFAVWFSSAPPRLEAIPKVKIAAGPLASESSQKSYEEVRASALAHIQEVLTPAQVQRWKEMIGEPVDARILAQDHRILVHHFKGLGGDRTFAVERSIPDVDPAPSKSPAVQP
ncbi:MAG TPA: serine/threonine-protein kinase [Gemmataceae bacterium]|nr:serine/threonine-protein kinase [Gemmataceae bacterium]